jgi:hypothetical protein
MKSVKVTTEFYSENVREHLNHIRELKDLYLYWCIEGTSPADDDADMLTILRNIDGIDKHFLLLEKKMDNVKAREKGDKIPYPEVE